MSKQVAANKYRRYSPSKLVTAISMVQSGVMSKKKAAMTFGIPRTTLIDKLSEKAPMGSNPGKQCVLTVAEERALVDYIKLMSSIGYPLKRQELCYEVKKVLDHDGRKTPFKDNLPGKHWYQLFSKRHPELCERTAMALGHQRSLINFEMVEEWFSGLTSYLKQEVSDWKALINDPRRMFNADESGFPLSVTNGKVLTEKGVRHVYQVCTSNKTQITVLVCFNAYGNYVSPLIVYPGERFRDSGIHEFDEAIYGHTSSGWMDSELFVEFLKHLNEFVINRNIPKPIMLLVDGHSTHMSFDAVHYCFSNGIILYCLLANATHVLQPCDVDFFSPMKAAWKKEVKTWQLENLGQALTKKHFPGVFKKAWLKVAKIENAIHGFQKCGLFPLNPNNIDLTKLNPSKAISHTITSESGEQIGDDKDVAVKVTGDAEIDSVQLNNTSEMSTSSNMITSLDVTTDDMNTCISTDNMNTSSQISTDADDKLPKNFIDSCEKISHLQGIHKPTANITDITDISSGNQAPGPSYVKQSREMVSESFSLLAVPEAKKKRSANTLRKRLPKALSGKEALRILQEKENAKKADELAKQKRKEEREKQKKQRNLKKKNSNEANEKKTKRKESSHD